MSKPTCNETSLDGRRCTHELMNPLHRVWKKYTAEQIESVLALCGNHASRRLNGYDSAGKHGINGMRRDLIEAMQDGGHEWIRCKELAIRVYGDGGKAERNAVRTLVYRVRQLEPRLIESMPYLGYRLAQQPRLSEVS